MRCPRTLMRVVATPLLLINVLLWHPTGVVQFAATPARAAAAPPSVASIVDAWWTNEDTLNLSLGLSPTLVDEVLDRPDSYAWEGTVPDGWATTPYVNYGSYAAFASDISPGTPPETTWVMYDPEQWYRGPSELQLGATTADVARLRTPSEEQLHPAKYMKLFARLAHDNGYSIINAPGLSLLNVAGADCTK